MLFTDFFLIYGHFVPHRDKFTVAQSKFYDGKFTAKNSKKGVNRKTGGKV
jgi:hypothetical protein